MNTLSHFNRIMDMTYLAMTKPHPPILQSGKYSVYFRRGAYELERHGAVIYRDESEESVRDVLSAHLMHEAGEEIS